MPHESPPIAQRHFVVALVIAVVAIAGWAIILIATRQGPGIEGDSVSYISTARSILAGEGVKTITDDGEWRPLISFPPLFPVMLATLTPRGGEVIVVARHLNAALLGITLALAGVLLWRSTRSLPAVALALLVLLASLPQLRQYQRVFTEPLFNATILGSLLLLSFYGKCKRREWLILAAILAASSCFARYAGMSMFGVGIALVVLYRWPKWKPALIDAAIFGAISITPILLWLKRNQALSEDGTSTGRYGKWHPPKRENWRQMAGTLGDWLFPPIKAAGIAIDIAAVAIVVAVILCGVCSIVSMLRRRDENVDRESIDVPRLTLAALLAFVVIYLPFLIYVRSYVDAGMPFNARILSPLFVPLVILATAAAVRITRSLGRGAGYALAVLAAVLILAHGEATRQWTIKTAHDGNGYLSDKWRASKTIARIRTIKDNVAIYSNGWDAIYILTDRLAHSSPRRTFRTSEKRNDKLRDEAGEMREAMEKHNALAVYFDKVFIDRDDFLFTESDFHIWMKRERTIYDEPGDGRIYRMGDKKLTTTQATNFVR